MEPETEHDINPDITALPKRVSWTTSWALHSIELREKRNRERELSHRVFKKLSNQKLREIILHSPSQREEFGEIKDLDFIFRFVPRYFRDSAVSESVAVRVFRAATEMALYYRLRKIHSFFALATERSEDGYYRIVIEWRGEKPVLPDYLKDISTLTLREVRGATDDVGPSSPAAEQEEIRDKE